jgi:hypothetical protein
MTDGAAPATELSPPGSSNAAALFPDRNGRKPRRQPP